MSLLPSPGCPALLPLPCPCPALALPLPWPSALALALPSAPVCPACSNFTSLRIYGLCDVCGLVRHSWVHPTTGARTCARCAQAGAHHEKVCTRCKVGYGAFVSSLSPDERLCRICVKQETGGVVRVRAACATLGCLTEACMSFVFGDKLPVEVRLCRQHGSAREDAVRFSNVRCVAVDTNGVRCGRGATRRLDGERRLCGTHGSTLSCFYEHVLLWIVAQAVALGHLPAALAIRRQVPAVMGAYYLDAVFAWPGDSGVQLHVEVDEAAHTTRRFHDAERQVALVQAWAEVGFAGSPTGTLRLFVEDMPDLAAVRIAFREAVQRAGGVVDARPQTTASNLQALALANAADGFGDVFDPADGGLGGGIVALHHWLHGHLAASTPVGAALQRLIAVEVPTVVNAAHTWADDFRKAVQQQRRDSKYPVRAHNAPEVVKEAYRSVFELSRVSICFR